LTRDERQEIAIKKWIEKQGIGTIVAVTGFGKTRIAIKIIQRYLKKYDTAEFLIVVPTEVLKEQWKTELNKYQLLSFCKVEIINTVIKYNWKCNLLIIDEAHRCASPEFRKVFTCVNYDRLLCLTATIKRLDGLEKVVEYYAPVCDEISMAESLSNNWVSEYQEYKVLLDVDLTEYQKIHTEFLKHFSFFDYNLSLALQCVGFPPKQTMLARHLGVSLQTVKAHTYSFMRLLKKRKDWVMNHPKKIEIAKIILENRKDKKVLTFSSSVKLANMLGDGYIIHHKIPRKERKEIIADFTKDSTGVLHSVDALREGTDVPGVSTAIVAGFNSSLLKKIQTIGRVIRKEKDKKAEVFTLVIKDTIEEQWFSKSSSNTNYITIEEIDLDNLLNGTIKHQSDVLYFE
jgi:superfamily II DNA or RNA helicase